MRPQPTAIVRHGLLLAAGAVGVLCLLATGLAVATGGSVLVIRSGSMEPGLPVGSVLVVRPVPASALQAGEVVGVGHPGGRTVVHRVRSVSAPGAGAAEGTTGDAPDLRSVVLRGDANPVDDAPVVVATALRPVVVVRHGWPGRVVAVLQSRWSQFWLGVLSGVLAATGWHRSGDRRAKDDPSGRGVQDGPVPAGRRP